MEWNWGVENGAQLVQQIEQARVDSVDRARAVVAQEIIDIRKGVLQVTAWLMTRWLPIDDAESFTGMGIVETQSYARWPYALRPALRHRVSPVLCL